MVHSVVLLTVVLGLGGVAQNIPLAVLAGILMKTGMDIIDLDFFRRFPQLPASLTSVMVRIGFCVVSLFLIKRRQFILFQAADGYCLSATQCFKCPNHWGTMHFPSPHLDSWTSSVLWRVSKWCGETLEHLIGYAMKNPCPTFWLDES